MVFIHVVYFHFVFPPIGVSLVGGFLFSPQQKSPQLKKIIKKRTKKNKSLFELRSRGECDLIE